VTSSAARPRTEATARRKRQAHALTTPAGLRALSIDALHLVVLSTFAFAEPLYRIIGNGAMFFVARDAAPSDIVWTTLEIAFLPPAALLAAELVAQALLGRWARRTLHVLFVAGLVAVIALPALRRAGLVDSARPLLAAAAAVGMLAAVAYVSFRPVRALLTFLAPAPILFVGLFLLASPVSRLVFPGSAQAAAVNVPARTPVVFVVFDEFSGTSLMDGHGAIDATRFPNFASLARDSLWFRNALTSALATERAIPAILTGRQSRAGSLAVFQDHPENLFTLLGKSYDLDIHETETHLCPARLCPAAAEAVASSGLSGLASDLGIVFGRFVLPSTIAERLPSVSTRWGNFEGRRGAAAPITQGPVFATFLKTLDTPRPRPTLHFVHVELPHVPWHYLPSGREYTSPNEIPGLRDERWGPESWLVLQAQQRYLLQTGYVDRLLGQLVRRLRSSGLYDRALVIVTADHGVSFHAGDGRRTTSRHAEDLALVPLFVKLPGQQVGRVVERPVQTIGLLPTIADVLQVRIPWHVDGRSVLDSPPLSRVRIDGWRLGVRALLRRRDDDLVIQSARFGAGRPWERIFAAGPLGDLVGKQLAAMTLLPAGTLRARVDDAYRFEAVDTRSAVVPTYVSGRLEGMVGSETPELALAINGRIAAVSRTYSSGGEAVFSFVVPESALRAGQNDLLVMAVLRSSGRLSLQPLGPSQP
jgi:hypothetical protein